MLIDDCFAIKEENGEMKAISDFNTRNTNSSSELVKEDLLSENGPVCIPPNPAADNSELLSKYNLAIPHLSKANKDGKFTKAGAFVRCLGFTDSSILSDSIVTISFEKTSDYYYDYGDNSCWGDKANNRPGMYKIKVTNKSSKNIYVDMTNSFRINSKGEVETFFNNTSVSHSSSQGSGAGINLGAVTGALGIGGVLGTISSGINVGKDNTDGTTITEQQDAIVVIPPGGTIIMTQRIAISPNGKKVAKNYDDFNTTPGIKGKQYDGRSWSLYDRLKKLGFKAERDKYYSVSELYKYQEMENLTYETVEGKRKDLTASRIITYSSDPNFSKYTSLKFDLFTKGYVGLKTYYEYRNIENDEYCIFAY
ncbi:MAG: hypothetical protein NC098_03055 [Lachnoclostridium sp.]|nr:hypothetical protein [Lachnoclostridium sp.]